MEMVCLGLPLRLGGDSENDFVPYVELAAHLGCQYLRVFADDKMQAESRQDWIVRVRAALDSYRRLAGSVGLVIENQGDTSACASLVEVLGDDGMILWDTAYSFKAGESYADSISILGSRLAHVQTKDQSREAGNWTRSCLFEGQLFVADALQALRSSGYRGYVSIENQSTSPRQDLARVTRWLNASMRADGFTE
jgi:sugar phosphate isomerase/epimerase